MHHDAVSRYLSVLLLLPALMWGLSQDCLARVGETKDQCIQHYGQPTFETAAEEAGMTEVIWNHSGLRIRALFSAGKDAVCEKVSFRKGDSSEMTNEDIQPLLKNNAAGADWVMVCNSGDTTQWLTSDFTRRAYYHKTENELTIQAED